MFAFAWTEKPVFGCWICRPGELPTVLKLHHNEVPKPVVQCTDHMCPIQVHWHVKQNYKQYWRVKITINNLNYVTNYSDWNLVVLHPNLENITQVFSFNYKPLNVYGNLSKCIYKFLSIFPRFLHVRFLILVRVCFRRHGVVLREKVLQWHASAIRWEWECSNRSVAG